MPTIGRPLKFRNKQELSEKIEEFKGYIKETGKPMTVERLACFLDCDSETLTNYEKKQDFFDTIKRIREEIKADKLERLNAGEGSPAGIIFDLKNNHKMSDKQVVDMNVKNVKSLTDLAKESENPTK